MAGQDDECAAQPDAEQRHAHRQSHRQHRPEGDDEDDDGEREAEQLGRRLFELGEQEAAELDLQPVDVRPQLAQLLTDVGGTSEVDVFGQVHGGERDLPGRVAACRDLEFAARRVGTLHRSDVVDLGHRREHLLHRGADRRVVHPLLGPEDDLTRLRRAAAVDELGLHEREAFGRFEPLEREVLAVGVADAAGDAVADDQRRDPQREHELAAIVAPRSDSTQHAGIPSSETPTQPILSLTNG